MLTALQPRFGSARGQSAALMALALTSLITITVGAHAGVGGAEWQPLYAKVLGMLQGWGGKFIALTAFAWGLFSVFARGSLSHGLISEGISMSIFILPSILDSFFTAVI
ncbi:hypothetical protein [Burkholderia cepacia]|uniref:hypothetical protein n=1 Tax=Burkholderia cepacia TaxID=292 RepID=UPI002AB64D0C|nr:hypothetical protein [Burkholderia cepacia]